MFIAGCTVLGLGVGLFTDNVSAGLLTGVGIGLIGEFFFQRK